MYELIHIFSRVQPKFFIGQRFKIADRGDIFVERVFGKAIFKKEIRSSTKPFYGLINRGKIAETQFAISRVVSGRV